MWPLASAMCYSSLDTSRSYPTPGYRVGDPPALGKHSRENCIPRNTLLSLPSQLTRRRVFIWLAAANVMYPIFSCHRTPYNYEIALHIGVRPSSGHWISQPRLPICPGSVSLSLPCVRSARGGQQFYTLIENVVFSARRTNPPAQKPRLLLRDVPQWP